MRGVSVCVCLSFDETLSSRQMMLQGTTIKIIAGRWQARAAPRAKALDNKDHLWNDQRTCIVDLDEPFQFFCLWLFYSETIFSLASRSVITLTPIHTCNLICR